MTLTRGSNQSGLRAHNERLVLSLIRQMGPQPKAEVARLTKLSAQTVSVIMRALESDGLLQKGEPVRGKVGQPSVPMGLVAEGAYFLGLKVGRRSLDLVLTDFMGRVKSSAHLTLPYPTPDRVVDFAKSAMLQVTDDLTTDQRDRIAGLGIAIPFRLWDWGKPLGVTNHDMDTWRDRDVAAEIADASDFPVYARNDGSAACGAELVFGDQDKPGDFLYFFIGFFVGGGLVMDNTLYTGRTGNAAALGSIPLMQRPGQPGQLVDVASLAKLERILKEAGHDGAQLWETSEFWDIPQDILTAWIEEAADGLAFAIASATCVIDVETVLIDGWLPLDVRRILVSKVIQSLENNAMPGIETPDIREGTIGSAARSLGAASLPLSDRFLVDNKAFQKG